MIPPDVAAQLRPLIPDAATANKPQAQTSPVAPAQRINDALSNLAPGQRILAEIQALLPNGTYRAIVSQREITLALPFSAKPGDSLELEVTENNGKMALAFVANRTESQQAAQQNNSAATSLSPTGKLIGDLLGSVGQEGKRPPPVALNGNQPLVDSMPKNAGELAATLKQAVTQSGVFYEAHQARWVAGELPTESLRQEPQGKLPAPPATLHSQNISPGQTADAPPVPTRSPSENHAGSGSTSSNTQQTLPGTNIPREITPVVQQQLEALANQQVVMHAQAWPGQQMEWEIDQNGQRDTANDLAASPWQTRLKLDLPSLGQIDAVLRQGGAGGISINLIAKSDTSESILRKASESLRTQYEAAGLSLAEILIQHDQSTP